MTPYRKITFAMLFVGAAAFQPALADCVISEAAQRLDPVEAGFCESDAVFVGKVEGRLETVRAFREEGSDRTRHFRSLRSTTRVLDRYKGKLPGTVTLISDINYSNEAFEFESGKTYLVFAKRLAGENEYSPASAACSVQPTLPVEAADAVLKQLALHKKGRKPIDCKNIRPKE